MDFTALQPGSDASDAVRATAEKIGLTPDAGYRVRLTGDVALQDEEFGTLAEGAALNSSLMGVAVLLILWRALRWGRLILAVTLNMLIGLAFTAARRPVDGRVARSRFRWPSPCCSSASASISASSTPSATARSAIATTTCAAP